MDKSLRQQEIVLPPVPVLNVDPRLTDYLQQLHNVLTENNRLQQTKVEQFDYNTLVNEATPSVISYYKHSYWVTGGTTTITNFDQGYHGQVITVIAEHSVTITHGTNIILNSGSSMSMTSGDTLTLILKSDDKWYQLYECSSVSGGVPNGRLYLSGNFDNLSETTIHQVPIETVDSDFTDGIEQTVNFCIFPQTAGFYLVCAGVRWFRVKDGASYDVIVRVGVSWGATSSAINQKVYGTHGAGGGVEEEHPRVSDVIYISETDKIFLGCRHFGTGVNAGVVPDSKFTFLTVQRVR